MRFIDEVNIKVIAGNGGNGVVSFRRERFVPFGGPDGGNGGSGGSVFIEASNGINTLVNFRGKKIYKAEDGVDGAGREKFGPAGVDITIKVPVGTIVKKSSTGEIVDLNIHGEKVIIAKGGRGGLGNINFKSATNQAPRKATPGKAGEEFALEMELKLLADIAIIGLPNVGKSTLISVISAARPKVADYEFTTLEPNLGVVKCDDQSFVVADIPGLIEDASKGKGLGIKFLKHIERTSAFVHLVDCSMCLDEFEAFENYVTVKNELEQYNLNLMKKKEVICLAKTDAMNDEEIAKFQIYFEEQLGKKVLPISAISKKNIDELKRLMVKSLGLNYDK